jgi:hypothetical protein
MNPLTGVHQTPVQPGLAPSLGFVSVAILFYIKIYIEGICSTLFSFFVLFSFSNLPSARYHGSGQKRWFFWVFPPGLSKAPPSPLTKAEQKVSFS